jgi:osmotically-inducible protein OsmY
VDGLRFAAAPNSNPAKVMKIPSIPCSLRWTILAAAIGSAAATPELGPSGTVEIADFIAMDVKADRQMNGSKVEVAVEGDLVTLSGTALSLQQAERAVARAKATDGVRAVVNRLRIIDPIAKDAVLAERVQQRLGKSPALDAKRVQVSVDKRRAVLRGQIGSWDEQELAREIATEIPGIKEVDNRLEVTFDTVRTDAQIKAQLEYMISDDPLYAGITIDVKVKDGMVDLGGAVGSMSEKEQLVHRSHVTGVTGVKTDDLMVSRELAMEGLSGKVPSEKATLEALSAAIAADPRLKQADIRAEMDKHVMKLSGTVPNEEVRAAAESTARGLPGVSVVANEIQVRGESETTASNNAMDRKYGKDRRMAAVKP